MSVKSKAPDLNWPVQGGQLYRAFHFSKVPWSIRRMFFDQKTVNQLVGQGCIQKYNADYFCHYAMPTLRMLVTSTFANANPYVA
jgi:hypothetical protein